ncbi:MAG TPA: hypothetical protein VK651_09650 [Blastocatellia bacterium]|nr:hypothetical protein [Blastocatellia bacterium]
MSQQTDDDQESTNPSLIGANDESPDIPSDWLAEFEAAARRPLEVRMRYSFIDVEGFPVCHLDDIIASKAAANRQRDRESLPRLRAFREYWLKNRKL